MEWAGEYYSQRLDRSKPLWEMVILELADGRWAIVTKTHHCMIDGVGSVDMATTLLDTEPERRAARNGSSNGSPVEHRREHGRDADSGLAAHRLAAREALPGCRPRALCGPPRPGSTPPSRPSEWPTHPEPGARGLRIARGPSPS